MRATRRARSGWRTTTTSCAACARCPGVEAAGITDALPLGRNRTWGARAKGVDLRARPQSRPRSSRIVSDGYPAAMGIPLRAGRDISPRDDAASEPVIVDQRDDGARTVARGRMPIGKTILGLRAPTNGASWASSATFAISRSSRRRATRCTSRCGSAATSRRPISSCVPRLPTAGSPTPCAPPWSRSSPNLAPTSSARCSRSSIASVSPRRLVVLLLGGVRGVRADSGLARHLRADLVLGQSADAGDRNPHGARRVSRRRAGGESSRRRFGSPPSGWRSASPRHGRRVVDARACSSASPPRIR